MQSVVVESGTVQVYKGVRYYKCGAYFQHKGVRLHRMVWEDAHGKTPDGTHVHHIDGNKANNSLENLALMDASEHLSAHMRAPDRLEYARANAERIRPLTKRWHGSAEGKEWHSRHAKETAAKATMKTVVCTRCGCAFESVYAHAPTRNRFCSGKCRAKHLRDVRKAERGVALCV